MRANKAKNTKLEIELRKALWALGARGYRNNPNNIPGRPDIVFIRKKIAIFVNGCFWHSCKKCKLQPPKTHTKFWQQKFERNRNRDIEKKRQLNSMGWKTIIVWEHEIKKDVDKIARRINNRLE